MAQKCLPTDWVGCTDKKGRAATCIKGCILRGKPPIFGRSLAGLSCYFVIVGGVMKRGILLCCALGLVGLSLQLFGQGVGTSADIKGTVTDSSGALSLATAWATSA